MLVGTVRVICTGFMEVVTGAVGVVWMCERARYPFRSLGSDDGRSSEGHGQRSIHDHAAVPEFAQEIDRFARGVRGRSGGGHVEPETLRDADREPHEHPALLWFARTLQILRHEKQALHRVHGLELQEFQVHVPLGSFVVDFARRHAV